MFDTDEVTNSVVVGVATEEARQAVLVRIATLNLPLSAVAVEVLPQAEYATTLLDQNIPTSGGVAIQWPENLAQQCTLGVNVWYAYQAYGIPAGTEGFYTASHCSQNQGNMSGHTWLGNTDNTPYYQHGVRIGTEGFDPPLFWEPACQYSVPFPYLNCRNSDVTFVRYDYSGMASHGYIEQTLFPGFGVGQPGSIDIASPSFTITSTACCPLAGYMVDKVGWATGWTEGFVRSRGVDRTCADMITSDSNTYILCSYEASAFAGAGDSGAPVFQLLGNYNVAFTGIVWARSGDGRFWFSDISQIAKDMGTAVNYLRY